jgi:phytoene desaturase
MKIALVIGSGIAGLAAALRLRAKGFRVNVFDRNAYTGGKLAELRLGAYRFDAGPSLFTLPEQVDELFKLFGENPRDHFNYVQLPCVCNYFWDDGQVFSASAQPETFVKDAAHAFDVKPQIIKKYLHHSRFVYETTAPVFLDRSLHKLRNFLNYETLRGIWRMPQLGIFGVLHQTNKKQLGNARLTQLFDRYATYNGSDPYRAPAVLQSIPHLEYHTGAWMPHGGMRAIVDALTALAKRQGVEFMLSTPVERIMVENGQAIGLVAGGTQYFADHVVCNSDVFSAYRALLPEQKAPERTLSQERSSSALIFYWGVKKQFQALDVHNIFFSKDYKKEFALIFEGQNISDDPTVYVHITSSVERGDAPEGCSNWFVMINVPGNTGQNWADLRTKARAAIIRKLDRCLGANLAELIEEEDYLDPPRIEQRTGSHQGSLYGAASNSRFAAFLRHPNFSHPIKNLWFCGGSVHPGGGIPLCLKSAKIAAQMIR